MKLKILPLLFLIVFYGVQGQETATIHGHVYAESGGALQGVSIQALGTSIQTFTDKDGFYQIKELKTGQYTLSLHRTGYKTLIKKLRVSPSKTAPIDFILAPLYGEMMDEVIKEGKKREELEKDISKMNALKPSAFTRLPVEIQHIPQSISVVSDHTISQQGSLDLYETIQNIPGIYPWAIRGNSGRNIGGRGLRDLSLMIDNVPLGQGRGRSSIPDMEAIEEVQVIRGASAIQYGNLNAGGLINLKAKRPKFSSGGYIGLRTGSWNLFRPSFDLYGPLNEKKTVAYRIVGLYESAESFRKYVNGKKIYINPSLRWQLAPGTALTFEYSYLNDSHTPDHGTMFIQKHKNDPGEIYNLPFDRFTGTKNDRITMINRRFTASLQHKLNENFTLNALFNRTEEDNTVYGINRYYGQVRPGDSLNGRIYDYFTPFLKRSMGKTRDAYKYNWAQIDLLGANLYTGDIKHDLQVGIDFLEARYDQYRYAYDSKGPIDIIDITSKNIDNDPKAKGFKRKDLTINHSARFGLNIYDIIAIADKWRVSTGLRYTVEQNRQSKTNYSDQGDRISEAPYASKGGFSPTAGLMYSPIKNLNLYASYTNTFDAKTYRDKAGKDLGANIINQIETGLKSTWFDERLLLNVALYRIFNNNAIMKAAEKDENGLWVETNAYTKTGKLLNQGVEVELRARPTEGLELIGNYTYQDARYKESDLFVKNAVPFNVPRNLVNLWAHYTLPRGIFKNLSFGIGVYRMGERWMREANKAKMSGYNYNPDDPRPKLPAYTLLRAAIGYRWKNIQVNLYANNLLDQRGYLSYRTLSVNPINPRNYSVVLRYHF